MKNHIDNKIKRILRESKVEKSWSIEENRPIPVSIHKTNSYYIIEVPPMSMKYETFQELGDNLNKDVIDFRLKNKETYGLSNISEKQIKYPTDVSHSTYDYENGEATFTASSIEDVKNWLKLYDDIIKVNETDTKIKK